MIKILQLILATTGLQMNVLAQEARFAELWPLKPGNRWTTQTTDAGIQETIVERDSLIDGQRWSFIRSAWFANLEGGVHILGKNGAELLYAYPARSGTLFVNHYSADSILVVNNRARISIPMGDFTCMQYRFRNKNGHTYLYFAPGVGPVKREVYQVNNGKLLLRHHWELINCILK